MYRSRVPGWVAATRAARHDAAMTQASPDNGATPERSEFRQGWRVVVAAMLGVACGASPVPYAALGQFVGPLHEQLGWSFRDISLGVTIFGVLAALLAPYFGALGDRHGVRRVALWSLLAFGIVFALFGLTPDNIWAWWAGWLVLGLVGIGSTPVTWTRGVNLWFFRQRGLALGVTLIGTSLTGMAVPKLAAYGIEHFGWRATFPLLALLPLLIALPVALLWFHEPRDEQRPVEVGSNGGLTGVETPVAVRDRRFWLIFASVVLIAMAYGGVYVHLQQMLLLKGFDKHVATNIVVTMSAAIMIGRVGTGWLLDRFWAPLVTLPVLCAPALACVFLAGDALSLPAAVVCALLIGLAAGAETDLIAYLAGRYFGMRNYGRIYGFLYMPFGAASAISPALYGWVRDTTGNYNLALHFATVMFVAGALLLLLLGRYPDFARAKATD